MQTDVRGQPPGLRAHRRPRTRHCRAVAREGSSPPMNLVTHPFAIRAGVAGALLLLAAIAATSLVRMNRFADAAQWVDHTHEVIEGLDAVLLGITEAETAQRGFLLTSDETYLIPYSASRASLTAEVDRVLHLADPDSEKAARIGRVKGMIERRLALLDQGIAALRESREESTDAARRITEGSTAMGEIRAAVGEMKRDELALLTQRSATLERDRSTARLILVVGNAIALVLLAGSFGIVLREVRQRQEAELRARRYALQVEDLYNAAPCGYHSIDGTGLIVRINDTELSWLGYSREEVVNRLRLTDLLTPESRQRFEQAFDEFKGQGFARDLEYELVRKDGSLLPVAVSATLVRDANGNYLMSRSSVFDITKRKRAEQELHRANVFLDSVLEHIPNMMFVKSAEDLAYVRFNHAGELLLGLSRDAVLGKRDNELFDEDLAARFAAQDREVLASGRMLVVEDTLATPGGERILHTRKLSIQDQAGQPGYLLGISEDITEHRLSERKISELNQALELRARQLEATNKELESFSYSVSHDLRSPLRAIDGFSRILEEDHAPRLDQEGLRLLAVIRTNTRRMAQLIDDLLAFSRLGRQAMALLDVNMAALARESWEQLTGEGSGRAQLELGELPDAPGDPVLLRQVWANLLSNALKYSGKREQPQVGVSGRREDGEVVYCVSDNGVGFDMRYSDKLFGVFQRLHTTEEFPGTGVGLAIVKRVVARHGGRVWAESTLDHGARFYFTLPVR